MQAIEQETEFSQDQDKFVNSLVKAIGACCQNNFELFADCINDIL